jgi:beta-glucosidase
VEYREGIFVGYRYYDKVKQPVLFPFGHGLSYTTFRYSDPEIESVVLDFLKNKSFLVSLNVENTGNRSGHEIVQLYVKGLSNKPIRPEKELKGFDKVYLQPKEMKRISISLDSSSFSFYSTPDHSWQTVYGKHTLLLGSSCADIRLELQVSVVSPHPDESNRKMNELHVRKETNYFEHLFADRGVTSEEFYQYLGRKIPVDDKTDTGFHRNSTLGECQNHWICRLLYKAITIYIRWMAKGDESQSKTLARVLPELPLRGLVLMSSGVFTYRCLDVMILWINGKRGKAIKRLFME